MIYNEQSCAMYILKLSRTKIFVDFMVFEAPMKILSLKLATQQTTQLQLCMCINFAYNTAYSLYLTHKVVSVLSSVKPGGIWKYLPLTNKSSLPKPDGPLSKVVLSVGIPLVNQRSQESVGRGWPGTAKQCTRIMHNSDMKYILDIQYFNDVMVLLMSIKNPLENRFMIIRSH